VLDRAAITLQAGERLNAAPEVSVRGGPYDVAVPASGRGFVRLEIAEPATLLIFTRGVREAVRMIAPLRVGTDLSLPVEEACGGESGGADLGFGGSDEYCRTEVQDHRYYDAFRVGTHFLELRATGGPVRLWLTSSEGHRFEHRDEHMHL
jgi:hypothetical protein